MSQIDTAIGSGAGAGQSQIQQKRIEDQVPTLQEVRAKTQRKESKWQLVVRGAILPVIVLAVWQICGSMGIVSKTLLPTPYEIWLAFYDLLVSGQLFTHLEISIWRAAVGFLIGGSLGLILLIAKGAFFPLYVQTFLGIRNVDSKLFDVARVLEFSRFKQITKLVLPAALPNVLLGLRLSIGVAWLGLVVAEIMGSSEGIGYLIMDARQFSQTSVVFVGILIFAFVGKGSDSLVRFLEKKLLKWRDNFNG